jgi:hypothetical protein
MPRATAGHDVTLHFKERALHESPTRQSPKLRGVPFADLCATEQTRD